MDNLSNKEIDIIVEALSIWEERCSPNDINPVEVGAFNMDSPNLAEAVVNKMQEIRRLHEKVHMDRRELSTLLKAKLISMKQARAINHAITPQSTFPFGYGSPCAICGGPHKEAMCPDNGKKATEG